MGPSTPASYSLHRRRVPLAAALVYLLAGCSGPEVGQPAQGPPERSTSERLGGDRFNQAPTLSPAEVEVVAGEPLELAYARAVQAYRVENREVFEPRRAFATSAANEFAWYFTVNDAEDAFGRTNHVFFVATEPWTVEHTRDFLISYLVMAAAPVTEAGRTWFHFYTAFEPPLGARFLFSNTALGAFEATILTELGAVGWPPESTSDVADWLVDQLTRLGLADRGELVGQCPAVLDRLYTHLPRPGPAEPDHFFGRGYVPEGTLVAIGILLGESIRAAVPGAASWEADLEGMPYPRLRIHGAVEGILRPIAMMVELFAAEAAVTPSEYCRRMIARLTSRADEGGP